MTQQTPTTLSMPSEVWAELMAALAQPEEAAAILLAEELTVRGSRTLATRDIIHIAPASYDEQSATGLSIRSTGWVHSLARAERDGLVLVIVHTHPAASATPSSKDDVVAAQLLEVAEARLSRAVIGTLIVGGSPQIPEFTGRLHARGTSDSIDRVRVAGPNLYLIASADSEASRTPHGSFDRQVRAFGPEGQLALASLRVAVVGVGGTGSAVLQQLARLGVGNILVVDPDRLTSSNVTRVYGSTADDAGLLKVDIAAHEVDRIGLGTVVTAVVGNIVTAGVVAELADRDVVFGCTDDHAGRDVLTRLPALLHLLLIDMGVAISSHDGVVDGVYGRVSVIGPGSACLLCMRDIDPAHLTAAQRPANEAAQLRAEGYAPELATKDPAVIAYTTLVAANAVSEMLDRVLLHTADDPPSRLLFRPIDRAISRQRPQPRGEHWCGMPWRDRSRAADHGGLLRVARVENPELTR